jgi:predicted porin
MKRLGIALAATVCVAGLTHAADLPTASYAQELLDITRKNYFELLAALSAALIWQGGRSGRWHMKKLGIALVATIGLAGLAKAADLPTAKPAEAPPPVNCFSGLWNYLNSTPAECPLSYAGFTVYSTIDVGLGYASNGAGFNPNYANAVANFISKQSFGPKWLWTPNGMSQSVVGINMREPIPWFPGWSLVGAVEAGFDPYSGHLVNSPRSLVNNNGKSLFLQSANSDSSRAGQFDNSVGYLGVSNPTFGTLTVGRVTSLTLDGLIAYDPMGGSYAFSPLGYTGQYAGFGNTETNRANTGVKYKVSYENFHGGGLVQWGGYDQGNGTTGLYQGNLGADFNLFGGAPYAGVLSLDAVGSYAQNAVSLGSFTGTCATLTKGPFKGQSGCSTGIPQFYGPEDLQATLSNNTGTMLLAKYRSGPWTLSGGWLWWQQANPSDTFLNGFETLGGYSVPATIVTTNKAIAKLFPTQWVISNAYNRMRVVNVPFVGAKYAINPQLDVTGAFYYLDQNNYNSSTTPCAAAKTSFVQPNGNVLNVIRVNNKACAGTQDALSFMIDYRPVKRVDLYGGVMISNVYGGLANGYLTTQNIGPTAGLRIKF